MTDPERPAADPASPGREPGDPADSTDTAWDARPGTSSAPGELAGLVTPAATPAPVWPAPGSVPPWSGPESAGSAPAMPGSPTPGGPADAPPTASAAVSADGLTPPAIPTPPAAAPAKRGVNIGGWLVRGGIIAAIVVGGLIFRDRLTGGVTDLKIGDCFDAAGLGSEVAEIPHQPCTDPHDAEVFYVGTYPDQATYPTDDEIDTFIVQQCFPAFQAYVGRSFEAETELDIAWFYPVPSGWSSGDRGITCHLMRLDGGKITGSVKV